MTDKEKIREEIEKKLELMQYQVHRKDAYKELKGILTYIDSMQEEPVSEDLEEVVDEYAPDFSNSIASKAAVDAVRDAFKAGAKWRKGHLWKPADGDDLPEIDREVIALLDNGKVVFAHRPPEYWDGKNIITGKVTRYYPKTYDKGGWNIPDVKWFLDVELPKEIEL